MPCTATTLTYEPTYGPVLALRTALAGGRYPLHMTELHVSLYYGNSFENTYYKRRSDKRSITISDIS